MGAQFSSTKKVISCGAFERELPLGIPKILFYNFGSSGLNDITQNKYCSSPVHL